MLHENIQNQAGAYHIKGRTDVPAMTRITSVANFTRFYIIVRDRTVQLPIASQGSESKALLRLRISLPSPGTNQKDILQYLSPSDLRIGRIDRRPSDDDVPFRNTYFVEVMDMLDELMLTQSSKSWSASVEDAINTIRDIGGEVDLIGLW